MHATTKATFAPTIVNSAVRDIAGLAATMPMIAAAVAPWALGLTGWVYGAASVLLSALFLMLAFAVAANKATEPKAMGPEKRLFAFSILYLFGLFAALVIDRWMI